MTKTTFSMNGAALRSALPKLFAGAAAEAAGK